MAKYIYKKARIKSKLLLRLIGLGILISGVIIMVYVLFPLFSWQVYFAPVFASQDITSPIPKATVANTESLRSLIARASKMGIDYTNAQNWYPSLKYQPELQQVKTYNLSIPALEIKDAIVSTQDTNLTLHLVNYSGTAVPPQKGNAVIFGHSTLPQLYDPKNYKTIFANAYKLKNGDEIIVNVSGFEYKYKIFNITVVEPEDTSVFQQNTTDSFLTLITCTPPGTTWKRLVIKAKIELE